MKFLVRWIVHSIALYAAIVLVPGIEMSAMNVNGWIAILLLGLVFSLLNAVLRPILVALTCPLIILTLGLGTLLINTLIFVLTGAVGRMFGWGFTVDGFIPAFLGALVVSVVSILLNIFLPDQKRR